MAAPPPRKDPGRSVAARGSPFPARGEETQDCDRDLTFADRRAIAALIAARAVLQTARQIA